MHILRVSISSLLAASLVAALGVALQTTTASPAAAATPGLVAEYGFNEGSGTTARDLSPNLLHGTVNGATWDSAGRFGSALLFNGSNARVDIPDADALDLTTGMTLEAWIRPTSLSGWRTVLMKERPSGLSYALYASEGSSRPNVYAYTTAERAATSASTIPANMWTHLAATYSGSTLSIYVNGALAGSTAVSGSLTSSTGGLRIGGNAVWGEYFTGLIDEVRIYDRPLTPAEIQTDMATPVGSSAPPPPPPPPPDSDVKGRWSTPFDLGLVGVDMIQLHTGKVLVWDSWGQAAASATVWDPATGSKKSVPAPYNIFCSGHAQLADGRILVAGGHGHEYAGFIGSNKAAIFDPATESWTPVPSMSQARWYPGVTTLPDGRVIVTSGSQNAPTDYADVPEVYDPVTNSWTRLTDARLGYPYYPFSYLTSDGSLLIAGSDEYPAPTRKLNLATQQWTTVDPAVIDGGSAAMFGPDKLMKSGSSFRDGLLPSSRTTYVLDLSAQNPRWRQTADMAFPRTFHTLSPLPDGTVIATGGGRDNDVDSGKGVLEAEIWSPVTETWSTMAPMAVSRLYHSTSMVLPDARVVVAGSGGRGGQTNEYSGQFFEPPYLFKGQRPSLTGVPSNTVHDGTFTATTNQAISRVTLVRPGSVTHTVDMDTRHLELDFTQTGNQLSITAPPNANVAPPGYYMVYALNAAGVPSVASFIRLPKVGSDTTPPAAPADLSANGSLGRVDLTWTTATDNLGVTAYDVHRSTTSGFTPTAATKIGETTTATTYADTGRPAGTYYYKVVARDAAGNQSAPSAQASATVPADTTAPTVSVTAPADGASVAGSVPLAASASDNVGVTPVQFRVDGADEGAPDTTSPYGLTWNSAAAPNGEHTVRAAPGTPQGTPPPRHPCR